MVYGKITILFLFGFLGLGVIFLQPDYSLFSTGLFNKGYLAPIVSIGVIFVSFEGWQLLTYEYSDIEGGVESLKKGIFITIIISTLIYILLALVTTSLVSPEMIAQHKETVLAFAVSKIFHVKLLEKSAIVLVSLAAIFSTASAINATLFGTARFTYKVATEKALPKLFSFKNKRGIPIISLVVIGGLTALFTLLGSLEQITIFASLAFITVFGVVNYVCLEDKKVEKTSVIPSFGLLGVIFTFCLEIWHLFTERLHMLFFIIGIFLTLLLLEFLYFEREEIKEEVEKVEEEIEEVED